MRLPPSIGLPFLVFLPFGFLAVAGMSAKPHGSATGMESDRLGRRLWIDSSGVHVLVNGNRRWFRFSGGRGPSDPAVAALLKRSADGSATPSARGIGDRVVRAANDGFLAPITRLRELESERILTRVPSIDLDADGRGEILIQPLDVYNLFPPEVWEHDVGTTPFTLAHRYTFDAFPAFLEALGDLDLDGSPEIASGDFDFDPWRAVVQVWKQSAPTSYDLTEIARLVGHHTTCACIPVGVAINDLDGDHRREVIYAETEPGYLSINERRDGSDGYDQVFLRKFNLLLQGMIVTCDLNDNGRREVLLGGVPPFYSPSRFTGLFLYEADSDNRYRMIWNAGPKDRNMVGLADAGDTDGDGRREFLVASLNTDFFNIRGNCTLYEYDGAGGFRATWEVSDPAGIFDYVSVGAYDLDGDGRRELLCSRRKGSAYVLEIYKNVGDDAYQLLYSSTGETGEGLGMGGQMGFGDFDEDQRPELVLNEKEDTVTVTKVYETTEAFPTSPPVANLGAQPRTGAAPLSVNLTDLSEGIVETRLWDFGDGATSTEAAPTHVYERSGSYTVSLAVTGLGGSDTKVRASYVDVLPCPTKALLSSGVVEHPEPKLRTIRDFRDRVLARSQAGRALIASYYRNGAEVDRLLRSRASLRWKTARLLLGSLLLLDDAVEGAGVVTVDAATWAGIGDLVTEYQASGSLGLSRDLADVRAFLGHRATRTAEGGVRLDLRN